MTTLHDLDRLNYEAVAKLPLSDLERLQNTLSDQATKLKARAAVLTAALVLRFAQPAAALRQGQGKNFGVVHVIEGEFDVACDLAKEVKWNQKLCAAAVAKLVAQGLDPAEYVVTEFKISETKWKDWPERIRKLFTKARAETARRPTFVIAPVKADPVRDAGEAAREEAA